MEALKEPSQDFMDQVREVVNTIPSGRAATYGDVAAALATHPDIAETTGSYGARLVGQVMSRIGADVPWWRVIRSTGHPPKFREAQALPFYEHEGTPLIGTGENYRVDLKRARFKPGEDAVGQASLGLF